MKSRDFCFWLQGYLELAEQEGKTQFSAGQAALIKKHLALVFKHEIDPDMGGKDHQDALNKIHQSVLPQEPIMRC